MTIVDTSVWIEFFVGGDHCTKERLKELIRDRESIAYIDMIFLEIIQGIKSRAGRETIRTQFDSFICLPNRRSTIMLAAEVYQEMRKRGFTIRSNVDCLISAAAIETGARILHKDRDFEHISEHFPIIVEEY